MERAGIPDELGRQWIFVRVHDAVMFCQQAMHEHGAISAAATPLPPAGLPLGGAAASAGGLHHRGDGGGAAGAGGEEGGTARALDPDAAGAQHGAHAAPSTPVRSRAGYQSGNADTVTPLKQR